MLCLFVGQGGPWPRGPTKLSVHVAQRIVRFASPIDMVISVPVPGFVSFRPWLGRIAVLQWAVA